MIDSNDRYGASMVPAFAAHANGLWNLNHVGSLSPLDEPVNGRVEELTVMIRNILKATVAMAIVAMPIQSASAATALSVTGAGAALQDGNDDDNLAGYLIPALIVIALGAGLYFILEEEDEDDVPTSS